MESKMNKYDIKNFTSRIFSAVFFVPFIILPIIVKGYIIYLFYIFLLALMVFELIDMIKISKKKLFIYLYLSTCVLTFFIFVLSIVSIENISFRVIEIIITIWIFDTFCYLGGKIFNGKKLMPNISKGKTFNGLYSGIAATLVITSIYYMEFYGDLSIDILLVFTIIILSFLGDLAVSVLKRSINVKDTGNIMPGHGGIVDRMDSFVFVFFFYGIYLIMFAY
tara:strand:+ start:1278 stop:1943 length:666 start_codon:yes stop_codon:yes gene_type:complete